MKIKAKNPKISSMKLCVPVDGIITIDAEGIAEVSKGCAEQLIKGTQDWALLETEDETKGIESGSGESLAKEDEKTEREQLEEGLKKMTMSEMKDMASEQGLPEEEWGKITTKKLMTTYILNKFDELELDGEDDEEED